MVNYQTLFETFTLFLPLIVILAIWDAFWKIIGMWKAARNNHLVWFTCIAIFNTIGILPIIYILMHKDTPENK